MNDYIVRLTESEFFNLHPPVFVCWSKSVQENYKIMKQWNSGPAQFKHATV